MLSAGFCRPGASILLPSTPSSPPLPPLPASLFRLIPSSLPRFLASSPSPPPTHHLKKPLPRPALAHAERRRTRAPRARRHIPRPIRAPVHPQVRPATRKPHTQPRAFRHPRRRFREVQRPCVSRHEPSHRPNPNQPCTRSGDLARQTASGSSIAFHFVTSSLTPLRLVPHPPTPQTSKPPAQILTHRVYPGRSLAQPSPVRGSRLPFPPWTFPRGAS